MRARLSASAWHPLFLGSFLFVRLPIPVFDTVQFRMNYFTANLYSGRYGKRLARRRAILVILILFLRRSLAVSTFWVTEENCGLYVLR